MVTVVLVFNGVVALLCLYTAWKVWRLRSTLANIADVLAVAERSTYRVLHNAPHAISKRQIGTYQLRQNYRLLTLQLQQVQQILALLGWGQLAWQRYRRTQPSRQSHSPRRKKRAY